MENENINSTEISSVETPKKRGRPRTLNNSINVIQVVEVIKETGGRILETVRKLNMSVTDFYKRFRYNKKVEEALKEARQMGFEFVTDTLIKKAIEGDIKAIHLYLRYNPVAKENDWIDNMNVSIKNEKPLTEDERKDLVKQLFD